MSAEAILEEVQAMQRANPGMGYDQAYNAVESRRKARPGDVRAVVLETQAANAGMSFEEAWDVLEDRVKPFMAGGASMSVALVLANGPPAAREEFARVEGIARHLMAKNPRMTIGEATSIARLASPKLVTVKAVEPEKGRRMLIRGCVGTYVD
jgi:hypothetical protein